MNRTVVHHQDISPTPASTFNHHVWFFMKYIIKTVHRITFPLCTVSLGVRRFSWEEFNQDTNIERREKLEHYNEVSQFMSAWSTKGSGWKEIIRWWRNALKKTAKSLSAINLRTPYYLSGCRMVAGGLAPSSPSVKRVMGVGGNVCVCVCSQYVLACVMFLSVWGGVTRASWLGDEDRPPNTLCKDPYSHLMLSIKENTSRSSPTGQIHCA